MDRIGPYEILGELGRGGMGVVFRARDPQLGRDVALKVLRPGATEEARARFLREGRLAARLRDPGIVAVLAAGEDAGQAWLAQDLVPGASLAARLDGEPLAAREAARVVEAVARALAHAHAEGVIHRDVKPGNILLGTDGMPRLADFGLARDVDGAQPLSRSDHILGTPSYMAPEQVRGDPGGIDGRADVWACGVVLYECCAGALPFVGDTPIAVLSAVVGREPRPLAALAPAVPRDLATIVARCLEKDPAARYASAEALADDLARFLAGEPIEARPIGRLVRWARAARRHPGGTVAALALVLALLGGGAALGWQARTAARARAADRAAAERQLAAAHELGALRDRVRQRSRELAAAQVAPAPARAALRAAVADVDRFVAAWPDSPVGRYVRAQGRLALEDLAGAVADLQHALAVDPAFRPGWTLLGCVRMRRYAEWRHGGPGPRAARDAAARDELAAATDCFARGAAGGDANAAWARWGLAWTREEEVAERLAEAYALEHVHRDLDGARTLLERALAEYRAEPYATARGTMATTSAEAARWYGEAAALAPGIARTHYNVGNAFEDARDWEPALQAYARATALDPEYSFAWGAIGRVWLLRGEPARALEPLDRACRAAPDDAVPAYNRAIARDMAGDLPGARADFDRALALEPHFAEAWMRRGYVRGRQGDAGGAEDDFARALALLDAEPTPDTRAPSGDPRARTHYFRGELRAAQGHHADALADFEHAVALDPAAGGPWRALATAHLALGDRAAALDVFTRGIEAVPGQPSLRHGRAQLRQQLGDVDGALADCDAALALKPDWAGAWNTRGTCHLQRRDGDAALADFDRALAIDPDERTARWNRGMLRRDRGDRAGAAEDLGRLLDVMPADWPDRAKVVAIVAEVRR